MTASMSMLVSGSDQIILYGPLDLDHLLRGISESVPPFGFSLAHSFDPNEIFSSKTL